MKLRWVLLVWALVDWFAYAFGGWSALAINLGIDVFFLLYIYYAYRKRVRR